MKQTQELELIKEKTDDVAVRSDEDPVGLFKLAIESKAGADTLERVMAVRRELRAERAQEAFESALSDFQAECPVIVKSKGVPTSTGKIAYAYAPIEDIEEVIRPIEKKHGFNHTYDTDTASAVGWVIAKCIVTHRAGHSRTSTVKLPLGTKTNIMSDTQQFAAALTFANRRALSNAYGLVLAGEDRDGAGKQKPAGPSTLAAETTVKELAQELWSLLKPVRGTQPNWNQANQWLWREDILDGGIPEEAPNIPAKRFREVIEKAKEKLK